MSEVADPRVGAILDNRYTIIRRIADGGMASVYLANDSRLERTVAIKIIHSQLAQGPHRDQFLHRFHAEAKSAASIANPHIVQVYDTGEFDGLQYIVMEYVHGVNLRQAMTQTPTFSVRDTLRLLSETLDGLSGAHQAGLVHRDIKPENILINSRGHVEITDFGLAKAVSDATMGTTGLLLGTAAYLAPEMIESNRATPQGDLYSVGIMGYEMLCGKVPFTSDNPITMVFKHVHDDVPSLSDVSADFPQPVVDLIAQLSARDPQDRPADATAALSLLRGAAQSLSHDQLFYQYEAPSADPTSPGTSGQNSDPDPTTTLEPLASDQEAPTQRLLHASGAPVVEASDEPDGDQLQEPQTEPQTEPTKKSHRRTVIISIVSAIVAIIAGIIVWWWFWGPGSYWVVPAASDKPCPEQSSTCTLEGASYSEYKKTLSALGIEYSGTQKYSDTVAAGDIISSSPKVNEHVTKRGGKLTLVVSKGVKQVTVPADLLECGTGSGGTGSSVAGSSGDAVETLKKLGFTNVAAKKEYSLDTAEGCVLSSSVDPGTTVNHGDAVDLVISEGPKPVEIPSLAGTSQKAATQDLEKLKLTVSTKESFSDSIAKGAVISSSPSQGQTAHWGDKVTLTISKGPETVAMPSLVGVGKDEAVKKLEDLGLKVKTESSALGETLHLVLQQSVDGGKSVRLRDTSGNPTVVTLTVV
jgi:serine/threonine-protein kinase